MTFSAVTVFDRRKHRIVTDIPALLLVRHVVAIQELPRRPGPARPDDGYVGAKIRKRPTPEHPARSRGEAEIIDPGARRVLVKTLPSDSTAVATARNDGRVPRTPSDHEREDSEMFTSQP